MRRVVLTPLAVTLLWVCCSVAGAEPWANATPESVEGRETPVSSPDGRWEIFWRRAAASDVLDHEIWLRSAWKPATARRIFGYGRHAEVLWSPDSKLIAINDRALSNEAWVSVFRVLPEGHVAEIGSFTERIKKLHTGKDSAPFDHLYVTALKWSRDSKTLLVQVKGHGDRREVDRRITVRVIP